MRYPTELQELSTCQTLPPTVRFRYSVLVAQARPTVSENFAEVHTTGVEYPGGAHYLIILAGEGRWQAALSPR